MNARRNIITTCENPNYTPSIVSLCDIFCKIEKLQLDMNELRTDIREIKVALEKREQEKSNSKSWWIY